MLTVIELLIGVVVIVGVARYIIKGYSATGVLFVGGLVLLIISALMGHNVLPASETSTGYTATDIVEYIKILLMSRGGDLGMMIMMLCGFAAYMTHIGANDMVVKLASKPLQYINSPYLLMIAAYFVACLMSLAVSSATGLGVLLMATLFPVMVNVGISRGAAAAICASPAAIILSPTSGDVVLAAKAAEMPLIDFAFKTTLPISIAAIIGMAIAHFFWQRYLDKKENISHEMLDVAEITTTAPAFYAFLPFTPIFGVLIFDGKWGAATAHYYHSCDLYAACRRAGIHARLQYAKCVFRSGSRLSRHGGCICRRRDAAGRCGRFCPRAEHNWLYPKPDLNSHLFWLR
ncbi:C4-dicarboxylate transporter DcuC [Salmonella enterica subsp. arizonae]|uniref:C4-dicarboxylate transporter DcuC n=1 Tax=Salmonella enterica subsp. arizonae TaxID=59203 RepID=A0A379TFF0_SALER|nr:C4-dicarboxylate transporter DcuC [Salmonella enterica subsp. arizonae]